MKEAIVGVIPGQTEERPVMTVWPCVCIYPTGRFLGRLYAIRWPDLYIFRLGHLLALLAIPHSLVLYFCRVLPWIGRRYQLTNRRIIVQKGLHRVEDRSLALDGFDAIRIEVLPGQEWYDAGDLVFWQQGHEVFRLPGVSRPEAFRQTCLKSHLAYLGVKQVLAQQRASA
jgi:hypothetical protein